jgi:hypothetical protein
MGIVFEQSTMILLAEDQSEIARETIVFQIPFISECIDAQRMPTLRATYLDSTTFPMESPLSPPVLENSPGGLVSSSPDHLLSPVPDTPRSFGDRKKKAGLWNRNRGRTNGDPDDNAALGSPPDVPLTATMNGVSMFRKETPCPENSVADSRNDAATLDVDRRSVTSRPLSVYSVSPITSSSHHVAFYFSSEKVTLHLQVECKLNIMN